MIKKSNAKYYFLALLISAITACIFIIPFTIRGGGIYYLGSDFVEQQIPFTTYLNNAIKSGNIYWSPANDLGTSFIGAYSFYTLGSPFLWLSLLIPADKIYLFFGFLLVIKMAVSGMTSFAYISRYTEKYEWAIVGSLIYTFCGYQISNMNFHFYDITALFPLLLIALDLSFYDDKKWIFPLAVAICATCNFVFFPGECVFLVLYLIAKLITKEYSIDLKKFVQMAVESVLGVGLSAVLLLPSVLSLLSNPRVDASWESVIRMLVLKPIYWAEIVRGSLFPAECIFDRGFFLQGFTNGAELYIPLFGLVLVFAYMYNKRKDWITVLLLICTVFAVIPVLNSSFVMFNSEYYTRWYNMPLLICALACAKVLDNQTIDLKSGFVFYLFQWAMLGVVFVSFTYYFKVTFIYNIVPVIMYVLISVSGFAFTLNLRKIQKMKYAPVFLTALVMLYSARGGVINSYYHQRTRTADRIKNYYTANEQIDVSSFEDKYRIYSGYYFMNLGTVLNHGTVTTFSSNIQGSSFDFYNAVGVPRSVITQLSGEDYELLTLLSAKYHIRLGNTDDTVADEFYSSTENQGRYAVKDYKYALPMGFTFDKVISRSEFEKLTISERRKALLKALVVENIDNYEFVDADYIKNDNSTFVEDYESRAERVCSDFEYTKHGFDAKFYGNDRELLFFSVPFDKGWTAYINGDKTDIIVSDYGFMAIVTQPGENNITFKYMPEGLKSGALISIFCATLYVALMCKKKIK